VRFGDIALHRLGPQQFGAVFTEHVAEGPDALVALARAAGFADGGIVIVTGDHVARAVVAKIAAAKTVDATSFLSISTPGILFLWPTVEHKTVPPAIVDAHAFQRDHPLQA